MKNKRFIFFILSLVLNFYFLLSMALRPSVERRELLYLEKRIGSLCSTLNDINKGGINKTSNLKIGENLDVYSAGYVEFDVKGWSIVISPLHPPYGYEFHLKRTPCQ